MKTPRRIAFAIALSLPLLSLSTSAQQPAGQKPEPTKEAKDEASRRFRRGIELFQEGDYRAALIEFRRANELAPNYNVLYNIGNVYFQLQDYANALTSFEQYLSQGGTNVDAKRRADVEKDIEKLRTRVARLNIQTSVPDAEVTIDDVLVGKTPFTKPVIVNPGRHRIVATKEGRQPASRTVEVASFDSENVTLEMPESQRAIDPVPTATAAPSVTAAPTTTATAPPLPPPPPPEKGPVWIGWAVTGGLAVGAAVCGVLALQKAGELKDLRAPENTTTRDELDKAAASTTLLAGVTDGLIAATAIAGAVTLVFTLREPKAASPATRTGGIQNVRVGVSPTGVQLGGNF